MKMTYIKVFILITLLLVVSCATKDPLSPAGATVIMPLKTGNMWIFDLKMFQAGVPTPTYVYTYSFGVLNPVSIDDEQWYEVMQIIAFGANADTTYWFYTNRSDGLWARRTESDTPFFKVKYPTFQGETYQAANEFLNAEGTVEVVSTSEGVGVPQGAFECYHYSMAAEPQIILHDYYRPNVGWVKSDWMDFDDVYGWYTLLLFELKGLELN
jgi:hypothetical protein